MLNKPESRIEDLRENINKGLENMMNQSELKNKKKEKKKNKNLGTPRSKQAERSIFIYKMLNYAPEKNGMISLWE